MDTKLLKTALSRFATGITVLTTTDNNKMPVGVTANSFTSVSLDPPLVLWCLGDQTFALEAFIEAKYYIVNILSAEQESISNNFARQGEFDRFVDIPYSNGIDNVPLIDNCLATLECSHLKVKREGDHWMFISKVEGFTSSDGSPLLYYSSEYRII